MKKFLFYLVISITVSAELPAKDIKGSVKTTDGKGVAGVVVSDGLNTTTTDKKGKFRMETDNDSRFVFISTPSGYVSSTKRGDETSYFKEIQVSGDESYDFMLEKNAQDDTKHNIIVIADPQISERDELPELCKHSADIAAYSGKMDDDYTFGICLGDIVGWDHSIYPEYNAIMADSGVEFRNVIGNHDMTNWGRSYETSLKNWEDMYGPAWYSFNVGDIHYVVLNDNFYVGRDYFYIGYLDERQLAWLEKDLSYIPEGASIIVNLHIPTSLGKEDRDNFRYDIIADNLCNKTALYSMLAPYNTLILSGHMHTANNQIIGERIMEQNISGMCGAWYCGEVCIDGSPAGYKVFDIDGTDIRWRYKGTGHPEDYQMKVYVDDESHRGYVVANVWDYDSAWKVEYFEDGAKVCDMEQFRSQDPYARELYKDPTTLKRSWVYAAYTDNMFRAKFSPDAKILEVRVTDRFGHVYKTTVDK